MAPAVFLAGAGGSGGREVKKRDIMDIMILIEQK
jgi:hypothetical protein